MRIFDQFQEKNRVASGMHLCSTYVHRHLLHVSASCYLTPSILEGSFIKFNRYVCSVLGSVPACAKTVKLLSASSDCSTANCGATGPSRFQDKVTSTYRKTKDDQVVSSFGISFAANGEWQYIRLEIGCTTLISLLHADWIPVSNGCSESVARHHALVDLSPLRSPKRSDQVIVRPQILCGHSNSSALKDQMATAA